MNKDSVIVMILLAIVIAAGVTFFIFSTDEEQSSFTPAPVDFKENGEDVRHAVIPSRTAPELAEFAPKDWTKEAAPDVVAEAGIEAELAATLYGKVVNQDGDPIEGAAVVLCVDVANSRAASVLGEVAVVATTDNAGAYRISGIAIDDRYALRVEAATSAPKVEPALQFTGGESRRMDFQLSNGLELRGIVLGPEDRPIPGVDILVADQASRAQDPQMDIEKSCVTDENGEFHCIGLNPGMKRVTAQAEGWGTSTNIGVQVYAGKDQKPVEFKLVPGGVTYQGRVVDADDELPLPGVLVRAQPISSGRRNMPNWNYPPVQTDDDGYFTFVGLMPGSYRFRAFGGQGYPTAGTEVTAIVPRPDPCIIRMKSGPSVVGRVIDAVTGEPVTRFKVTFSFNETNLMNSPQLTQRFDDPKGEFEYRGIQVNKERKDFWLHASAKGYAGGSSATLTTDGTGDLLGVEILMYKGAVAVGKVVDAGGNPVRGAQVELSPQLGPPGDGAAMLFGSMISNGMRSDSRRTGTTDDEGTFRIEMVPAGWFKVKVDHASLADYESEQAYEFSKDGTVEIGSISLSAGAMVLGRVLDKDGKAEANSKVVMRAKSGLGGQSYTVTADSTGRFRFRNVRPGIYVVMVSERGGQPDIGGFLQGLASGQNKNEIIVGDGQELDMGDMLP